VRTGNKFYSRNAKFIKIRITFPSQNNIFTYVMWITGTWLFPLCDFSWHWTIYNMQSKSFITSSKGPNKSVVVNESRSKRGVW